MEEREATVDGEVVKPLYFKFVDGVPRPVPQFESAGHVVTFTSGPKTEYPKFADEAATDHVLGELV